MTELKFSTDKKQEIFHGERTMQEMRKSFRTLTKEGLCAYCYYTEHEEWAREFSDDMKKGK